MNENVTETILNNSYLLKEKQIHISYNKSTFNLGLFSNLFILIFTISYNQRVKGDHNFKLLIFHYILIFIDLFIDLMFLYQTQKASCCQKIISIKSLIGISYSRTYKYRYIISITHCLNFICLFAKEKDFESNYIIIIYNLKFFLTFINYYSHFKYDDVISYYKLLDLYKNRKHSNFKRILDYTYDDFPQILSSCCICLMDFKLEEELSMLVCKHSFHSTCLVSWIKISSKCPYCRIDLKIQYKSEGLCR